MPIPADPSVSFYSGHANTMLFGAGGLEEPDYVWVGATLMAPGVVYVDHAHPLEEVYLSLTAGEWWNTHMEWTDPGPESLIYNPPRILHAMGQFLPPCIVVATNLMARVGSFS